MGTVETEIERRYEEFIGYYLARPTLLAWGTDEQKDRYVGAIDRTEEIWCQLFSEPGSGSDLAGLSTRAVRDGDEWVVDGQKVWSSLAHEADYGLLLARTDPDQPKHKGITYFICDMRLPGIEVRPLVQITGESEFNEVFLDGVRIPDSCRLGPLNEGWRVAMSTLMNERTVFTISPEGTGRGTADDLVDLAKRLGRTDDPVVRDQLMRLLATDRALAWTLLRADADPEANGGAASSVAKLLSSELSQRITTAAIDLSGPAGVAWEAPGQPLLVREFLQARSLTIAGGTSEIQRNILGERILGLPREPEPDRNLPWRQIAR